MKKASRKYLLTLVILLLGGYGYMHAGSSQNWMHESALKILQISLQDVTGTKLNSPAQYLRYSIPGTKDNDRIYSEENKEKSFKLTALKTFVLTGSYFTAFYLKISDRFFCSLQNGLLLFTHWFHASSSRYIVLRVLRI